LLQGQLFRAQDGLQCRRAITARLLENKCREFRARTVELIDHVLIFYRQPIPC
jgi:hypothetical protein